MRIGRATAKLQGEKSYPLHWNAGESYPFAWCARRIMDGDGDSIWIKYSTLKDPQGKQHLSGILAKSKHWFLGGQTSLISLGRQQFKGARSLGCFCKGWERDDLSGTI